MNSHVESEQGPGFGLGHGLGESRREDGVDDAERAGHREEEQQEVQHLVDLALKKNNFGVKFIKVDTMRKLKASEDKENSFPSWLPD